MFQIDINKICTTCYVKIDEDKYKNWRTVCKDCFNKKKRNFNIGKPSPNNNEKVIYESNNNRTLIIGFSKCGKIILMKNILSRKQGEIYINTKSISQHPQKNMSDEIRPLNQYENSNVVHHDMMP